MHRRLLCSLALLLAFTTTVPAQAPGAKSAGVQDIFDYIEKAWPTLTRSMDDCKTVGEQKFSTTPVLYVPAEIPVPESAAALAKKCKVNIQPLPQAVEELGEIDITKIKQPGLLYLPHPYVVPGGFFNEMYGWDSYFIIRGLVRAGKLDLAHGMVENFIWEIQHYGAVLNANRTYFLTRSQPPFLSSMVLAVYEAQKAAGNDDKEWLARSYNYIRHDHEMWTAKEKQAGDTGLSRYFDYGEGPVPESWGHEDNYYDAVARWFMAHPGEARDYIVSGAEAEKLPKQWPRYGVRLCGGMDPVTAQNLNGIPLAKTKPKTKAKTEARSEECPVVTQFSFSEDYYKGDRAMRESGYDISFRFGPFSGSTHHFAAVDLNSLLYKEETDLAQIATTLGKDADAKQWAERARVRKEAINRLMWDEQKGLYFDYDFMRKQRSDYVYITTFHALWAGVASPEQAEKVRKNLKLFEQPGGLLTSRNATKVQWDYPWGWAPNQLLAVEGLRRYGFNDDADRVSYEFASNVLENFRKDGTIREKYNVVTRSSEAEIQAGYKENVIGFGWTNGTFLELMHEMSAEWREKMGAGAKAATASK